MTSNLRTPRLIGTHLRMGAGGSLLVAGIVVVLAALAGVVPPALAALLDSATAYQLDRYSSVVRDLASSYPRAPWPSPGAAPGDLSPADAALWGQWESGLAKIREEAAPEIREAFGEAEYFTRLGEPGEYASTTYVVLDPRYAARIEIVDGRLPTTTATRDEWMQTYVSLIDQNSGRALVPPPGVLPATEIVMSATSAADIGWAIGETRDVGDEARWALPTPLTLVGTYDVVDPDDPYWGRATAMIDPSRGSNPDGVPYVRTGAFADPGGLGTIASVAGGATTTSWYPLDTASVTASLAPELLAQLRGFTTTTQVIPQTSQWPEITLSFHSGAVDALETSTAQARTLVAVLVMFASGPFGVAVAVLALGCRLIIDRRRPALQLLAARGASRGQLRALMGVEGAIIGLLPAGLGLGLGWVLARGLFPAAPAVTPLAVCLAVLLGIVPLVVVTAAATSSRTGRTDSARHGFGVRELIEVIVVLLTALATTLLVLRGTEASADAGAVDPLLVAAPLLLSLVACLLTLRLYPLVLRGVLAVRQRGSGFVGVLGAARAIRDPATGTASVLALVVGVSFAVSSAVLLSTVQLGAVQTARASVGADLLLSSGRFDEGAADAVADLDGVAAVAPISVELAANLKTDDRLQRISLFFADPALLDDVQQGYPRIVADDISLDGGTESIRLLFSAAAAKRTDAATTVLAIIAVPAEYAGSVSGIVPFANNSQWALTDAASLELLEDVSPSTIRLLVRLEDDADADAVLAAALEALGRGVEGTTAQAALDELRSDPVVTGLRTALIAGVALCAVLAAVAVAVTLVLGGRSRRRTLALLRTLGAPPRVGGGLVAWELVPSLIGAVVVGGAFGAALPLLLARVVDLRPFTGGLQQPPYSADPALLLLVLGGFIAVTALVSALSIIVTRRARIAAILRTVEDT